MSDEPFPCIAAEVIDANQIVQGSRFTDFCASETRPFQIHQPFHQLPSASPRPLYCPMSLFQQMLAVIADLREKACGR